MLGIISAVFRDMPILFVQGNMNVQCYISRYSGFTIIPFECVGIA